MSEGHVPAQKKKIFFVNILNFTIDFWLNIYIKWKPGNLAMRVATHCFSRISSEIKNSYNSVTLSIIQSVVRARNFSDRHLVHQSYEKY